ncbi:FUSC family protein [Palleronia aestuarii]|nr:FUSC family protein [Palleronia aestuarii]
MIEKAKALIATNGAPMPWATVAITCAAIAVPPLVAILTMGRVGAVAFLASLPAHLAAKDEGVPLGALVTLFIGMAGILSLGDPEMALIVAPLLGMMAGICGHFGFARPAIRGLITWTVFTAPIISPDDKPLLLLLYIAAMAWSLAVTRIFGQTHTTGEEEPERDEYALVFGTVMAVGLFLSVFVGGRFFGEHGFWFPLTFVVLCLPPHGELFSRTMKRTIGTVLGTAVAFGIALISHAPWLVLTVGALSLPLAFRFLPSNYTIFTALLTVSVLELLALASEFNQLAMERLTTMGAAAVMTLALGALGAGCLWLWKPDTIRALQNPAD